MKETVQLTASSQKYLKDKTFSYTCKFLEKSLFKKIHFRQLFTTDSYPEVLGHLFYFYFLFLFFIMQVCIYTVSPGFYNHMTLAFCSLCVS